MKYDPYLGRVISEKFRIIDFIGQGGMGTVYLAEHETLPRRFAIKILKSEFLENDDFVERFRREAIAASRVVHPNIVYITDFGRLEEGNFYIVMEYLEGEGIDSLLETHGKIPLSRAIPILIQISDALDHSHAMGIVHRDLKAENILLCTERGKKDVVKLLDFGIARLMLPSFSNTRITHHGQVFGTPEYMSPEQASDKPIDGRSDLYSLGVLAYELVVGVPPFYDDDPTEILQAHLNTKPIAPSSRVPELNLPKLFDGLVLKCLAKNPEDRFQAAGLLKTELIRVLNLLTRMASTLVTGEPALASSSGIQVSEQEKMGQAFVGKTVVDLRHDYHSVLKELFFSFLSESIIESHYSQFLDELTKLETEISGLNSNISFKEQEFEKIRYDFGNKETNLKYAHLDLVQEYKNYELSHDKSKDSDVTYLKDLSYQISMLKERIAQVSAAKKDRIISLNKELGMFRTSVEEREREISTHYAQMQFIINGIEASYGELVNLKYGVLFEKMGHLKRALEMVIRNAGSIQK
jgi:eukaryotic-like serine/threonine-protein kinase